MWYLDSGCSKHMTRDRSHLTNFVHKFLDTVKFSNDQVAKIMGYGYYQIGNVTISRVYNMEGLGHNLFSVGQFCDSDLEVAFRKYTCFVRNLEGVDLLLGSRGTNLCSLSIGDMMTSSPICLLSKATKTKSWLWYQRLSHLNFDALNHLARNERLDEAINVPIEDEKSHVSEIMPPKSAPMTQAAIRRMIKDSIYATIAAERARQANVWNDASASGPARGAIELRRWFEKTKSVFEISECVEGKKVKFDVATLEGPALTWWKTKVTTIGLETVNQMPWTDMKQLMTAEFCPIEEVQRMEHEL
nr:integrase, catalytic region, zinc finger, CCHC-type, peptidase aspartic, catalytic [Tanacetum cinerariifolium]